jgi:hypothetical protein
MQALLSLPRLQWRCYVKNLDRESQRKSSVLGTSDTANQRVDTFGAGYNVYKGKSSVQFKPIRTAFKTLESGGRVLDRNGVLLLEFANSIGERQYDWQNKITFALSVTEMAQIFLMPGGLQGNGVQCYHDPNMKTGQQGQV